MTWPIVWSLVAAVQLQTHGPVDRVRPGGALISGRIVEADTRRPIAGVLVTLSAQDLRAKLVAMTADDGTYAFEGIAPAPYILEADHPDYVPGRYSDGSSALKNYVWVLRAVAHIGNRMPSRATSGASISALV